MTVKSNKISTYLDSQLQAALDKINSLCALIPADNTLQIIWILVTNVEYIKISNLFGVGISTICAIVYQVCNANVHIA